jgi:hypothetical protein
MAERTGPSPFVRYQSHVTLTVLLVSMAAISLPTARAVAQTNPPGLVSLWAAQGDTSDSFGTNNGTMHGGVVFSAGKMGLAFGLDGTNGYIEVPDSPSLDLQSTATLMAWIYLDELPSQAGHIMQIMAKSQWANDLDLQVEPDNRVRFYAGTSPGVGIVASTTVLQTGVWYHVTVTYKANTSVELFINGTREAVTPMSVDRQFNLNPLTMGWNYVFPERYFHGRIDQARVFDAVCSEETIAEIFTVESGRPRLRINPPADICWDSRTNEIYQLQWISSLDSTNWLNLGSPLPGTGATMCVADSTPIQEKRFYRVRMGQ